MTRIPENAGRETSARKMSEPFAELVEQRARLENRLADFHRIAARLGRTPLPAAGTAIAADLRDAVARFDADLTLLADVVHDVLSTSGTRSFTTVAAATRAPDSHANRGGGDDGPEQAPINASSAATSQARASAAEVLVCQLIFVRVAGHEFALRVDDVREIRSWRGVPRSAPWHDRELNLVPLAAMLRLDPEPARPSTETNHKLVLVDCPPDTALLVDEVTRQDELVVRRLGPLVCGFFRGAVLGLNDQPILVLDPGQLVKT